MLATVKRTIEDRMSMREVAYVHIQKKIASRALRAGSPVSEVPIARELGISRTPTREAVRQLVTEGLLEQVPGGGVVVVTLERRDIVEIYELRKALEVQAVEVAARRLAGTELQNLRKIADEVPHLIQELRNRAARISMRSRWTASKPPISVSTRTSCKLPATGAACGLLVPCVL